MKTELDSKVSESSKLKLKERVENTGQSENISSIEKVEILNSYYEEEHSTETALSNLRITRQKLLIGSHEIMCLIRFKSV